MKRAVTITENHGGLSTDPKQGTKNSFYYSERIDFRKRPTGLSILPELSKESGSVVTDLITDMVQLPSGKIVAIGDQGGVYSRTTSGVWTKNGTTLTDTACGMEYNLQFDTIFISGLNSIHAITNADGRFSGGTFTVNSNYVDTSTDQSATDSTNTYTTTGTITETSANMLSFIPTIEPLVSVNIWVTTKGTGDVTVTMHDALNNLLGSVTKTAASLTNGALNTWTFTTPVRTTVAPQQSTFHFHVTHSGGTASTIGCATAATLSTARYETKVNRLVNPTNGFHPMMQFLQYLVIGNGRYLSAWEVGAGVPNAPSNLAFKRHILVFPSGYEVTSMATSTEYLAMAVEKKSTDDADEVQDGRIYFWDGVSINYNFQIAIPEGSPYGLFSHKNILYWFVAGSLWAWSGGEPVKVFQVPDTDTEFADASIYFINYPNTMGVRQGILMAGFPSETNNDEVQHAVYSYGSRNKNYANSFGLSYTTSNNLTNNGILRIGCVKTLGEKMLVSWRDDTTYGVDVVSGYSDPASDASYLSLIFDMNRPDKTKEAISIRIEFETLPTGATIIPKYAIDRGAEVQGPTATAGDTSVIFNINKRFKEIQIGFDATATVTTPVIISQTLVYEDLQYERD